MSIKEMIPWRKEGTSLPIRRGRRGASLFDFRNQMNRLFDEFFERPFALSPFFDEFDLVGDFSPRIDIAESDKEITITADLPGVEPEDIDIYLEGNTLTISGEKQAEKEEKGKRFYRLERSYGSFYRAIPLPDEVEEDKIDATFKRGVLKIRLPKTAEAQRRTKRITVKAQ